MSKKVSTLERQIDKNSLSPFLVDVKFRIESSVNKKETQLKLENSWIERIKKN